MRHEIMLYGQQHTLMIGMALKRSHMSLHSGRASDLQQERLTHTAEKWRQLYWPTFITLISIKWLYFSMGCLPEMMLKHKSSCSHFHRDMKETRHRFLKIVARGGLSEVNAHHNGVDPMSKVACVNVFNGQPTYHQMFLNALSDVVTGDGQR